MTPPPPSVRPAERAARAVRSALLTIVAALSVVGVPRPGAAGEYVSTTVERAGAAELQSEVGADEIRDAGADRLDEVLDELAGMQLTRASGLGVSATVDGLPAGQVTILVDGVPIARPLNSRAGPATDLASLPVSPSAIRRVEVTRGTGPAGSGDAGGVVVNIITERDELVTEFDASARGGLLTTSSDFVEHGGSLALRVPVADAWFVEASAMASGEAAVDADDDGSPDRPDQSLAQGRLGVGYVRSPNESLTLRGGHTHTRTTRNALTDARLTTLRDQSPAALNGYFDDRTIFSLSDVRLDGRWRPRRDVEVTHETSLVRQAYEFDKVRVRDDERLPVHQTSDLGARQSLVASVFADDHTIQPELVAHGGHTRRRGEYDDFSHGRGGVGIGATYEWEFVTDATLTARAFGEHHSDFGPGGVARLELAGRPVDALGLRLSGAATRRVPTPEEMFFRFDHAEVGYIIDGNPELEPERLLGGRAGFDVAVGVWTLDVDAYYQQLRDAISTEPAGTDANGSTTFRYINVDRVRSAGANAATRLAGLPGGLDLRIRFAWLPYSEVASTDERLPFTAEHDVAATLRGRWSSDRLSAWVTFAHRSDLSVPPGSPGAPSASTLDAGIAWDFDFGLRAQLDVENATGTTNPDWGPYLAQTLFLSLSYHFESL